MARYPLNLPQELKQEAAKIAKDQGVSLNQFILWAVSEKVGTMKGAGTLGDPRFPNIVYRQGASGILAPAVNGGIRVQSIVIMMNDFGMSAEEIAEEYDQPLSHIKEALAYYQAHPYEIERLIDMENQAAAAAGYG